MDTQSLDVCNECLSKILNDLVQPCEAKQRIIHVFVSYVLTCTFPWKSLEFLFLVNLGITVIRKHALISNEIHLFSLRVFSAQLFIPNFDS